MPGSCVDMQIMVTYIVGIHGPRRRAATARPYVIRQETALVRVPCMQIKNLINMLHAHIYYACLRRTNGQATSGWRSIKAYTSQEQQKPSCKL